MTWPEFLVDNCITMQNWLLQPTHRTIVYWSEIDIWIFLIKILILLLCVASHLMLWHPPALNWRQMKMKYLNGTGFCFRIDATIRVRNGMTCVCVHMEWWNGQMAHSHGEILFRCPICVSFDRFAIVSDEKISLCFAHSHSICNQFDCHHNNIDTETNTIGTQSVTSLNFNWPKQYREQF